MDIIEKLQKVKTMPDLDDMREEIAKEMIGHGEANFHKVQNALRAAKNRLDRIPLRDRSW